MAVYLTLTFVGWGAIITAFLLMFRWHKKDTEKRIEKLESRVNYLLIQERRRK